MNWDKIEGNWKQFKGKVKERWGKLTDDQLEQIAGSRDQLVGRLQEGYGISREEAERAVRRWETGLPGDPDTDAPPDREVPPSPRR